MAITPEVLLRLARTQDLHIAPLNEPSSPGQAQVFQIQPSALFLSALGDLVPTETVLAAAIPIEIAVTWGVEDVGGATLDSRKAVTFAGPAQTALQATVLVQPDFVELLRDQPVTSKTHYVTATAKLTAYEPTDPDHMRPIVAEVPLLRHPITIPDLPIPTVAMFFHASNLGVSGESLASGHQFVLIAVPADSAIAGVSALRDVFDRLRRISSAAADLVALAGLAADVALLPLTSLGLGLADVVQALDLHRITSNVGVAFVARDGVRNLNDVDMVFQRWNNIEAEDEISSLVFLAPPERRLTIYQHRGFSGRGCRITSSDRCLTIVRSLDDVPPISDPPDHTGQGGGPPALDERTSSYAFL